MASNTFNLSEKTIEAFKTDSSDKDELLQDELKLNTSQIRAIIYDHVPDGFELDDRIELKSLTSNGETGSMDVRYTYRRFIGDGEDEDNSEDLDIDFEIHTETLEITLKDS